MIKKLILGTLFLVISMLTLCQNFYWSHTKFNRYHDSGKAVAAAYYQSYLFISSNYGETWTPTAYQKDWLEVGISSTGQYILAAADGDEPIIMSSNGGQTWTTKPNPNNDYQACAVSADGAVMFISCSTAEGSDGLIYSSYNYGENFTGNPPYNYWFVLNCSGTGQYAIGSDHYSSTLITSNYGINWVDLGPALRNPTWVYDCDISETGQNMIVAVNPSTSTSDSILISNDYGLTWQNKVVSTSDLRSVACSGSGQYMSYVDYNGDIYVSSDYGNNWSRKLDQSLTSDSRIAVSATGKYQIAVFGSNWYMYRSTDYGQNWTQVTSAGQRYWRDIDLR